MLTQFSEFITAYPRLFVLTGAGISTASGIPDYRDKDGEWKHTKPIDYKDFVDSYSMRQRYWARSTIGWVRFSAAQPSLTHRTLAAMERKGHLAITVTQNVDRLHQHAGSKNVIDLHGRNDQVVCMNCATTLPRHYFHQNIIGLNPQLENIWARPAPDGDAHLNNFDFSSIAVPDCQMCDGIMKPNVVFFGENIPAGRVNDSLQALENADALLILGSSLMVYSGYRFVRRASEAELPIAAINLGKTRADDLIDLKIEQGCDEVFDQYSAMSS